MKLLLSILFLAGFTTAFSQQQTILLKPGMNTPSLPKPNSDSLLERLRDVLKKNPAYIDNMPNAFNGVKLSPVNNGNNGRGFDVYQSDIDNMPILMPDSTNTVTLRNGTNNLNIPNVSQLLNNVPKTYPLTPVQPKIFRIPK